jgi:transcriptional regulator with XRE-family HTH domain
MAKTTRNPLSETVRKRVRALRNERELTQEQLCEAAGLSLDAVSRIEHGTRVPTLDTIERLAKGLGVSVSSLIADTPPAKMEFSPTVMRLARTLDAQPVEIQRAAEKMVTILVSVASTR